MPSTNEFRTTAHYHNFEELRPNDKFTLLGSGNVHTDVVDMSKPEVRGQRTIQCIKHPLTDRDLNSKTWNKQQLEQLRDVLADVEASRRLYWARQPVDAGRLGRRESMAREHSIRVVERAIDSTRQKTTQGLSLVERSGCLVM